ncbi:hypothetical protein ACFVJH_01615 [Streptomyces decoyicus]|uniref:hypothetical protein n=1 Tax=Streptomyces decoyicus TaxID=249567 RepID=UPI00363C1D3E
MHTAQDAAGETANEEVNYLTAPPDRLKISAALYITVYTFHMPAFIIISGHFLRSCDMRKDRLQRLSTGIAFPYVLRSDPRPLQEDPLAVAGAARREDRRNRAGGAALSPAPTSTPPGPAKGGPARAASRPSPTTMASGARAAA